jgi:hypothetical protein
MTECTHCGAKANNSFLCKTCLATAQTVLADLPWWLSRLTEAAVGDTKMTDNAGRKSARRKDIDGDLELAACIELLPKADDLEKARKARQKQSLAHALATGGVNLRASELLAEIDDSLAYWCRVLSEIRGLDYIPYKASPLPTTVGANHARWLRVNIGTIAAYEDAADILGDIETHLEDIVKIVNRPIRWWHLGPCPGWRDDEPCLTELRVPEGSEEVHCRRCKNTHTVHLLLLARKAEAEKKHMTKRQLTRYNRELPPEFQIPPRTLQHWLDSGRLAACLEIAGDPLYSWVDVRLLMLRTKHAPKAFPEAGINGSCG